MSSCLTAHGKSGAAWRLLRAIGAFLVFSNFSRTPRRQPRQFYAILPQFYIIIAQFFNILALVCAFSRSCVFFCRSCV